MTRWEKFKLWIAKVGFLRWVASTIGRPLSKKEKQMLGKIFGTSWMTTILGYLAGATGGTVAGWTKPDGSINWLAVAIAVILAALGRVSKDVTATGAGQ